MYNCTKKTKSVSYNQSLVVGSIASKYFFSMKQGNSLCLKNVTLSFDIC